MENEQNNISKNEMDTIVAALSILHWDNGCRQCPLLEYCKSNDDNDCQGVWAKWLKEKMNEEG